MTGKSRSQTVDNWRSAMRRRPQTLRSDNGKNLSVTEEGVVPCKLMKLEMASF